MADLGVNAMPPTSNVQELREKLAYQGWLSRLTAIELQREEARLAEQRLAEEETNLTKQIQEYEAKRGSKGR